MNPIVPSETSAQGYMEQQVPADLLLKYADMIYSVTGIKISPQKKALLSNRLRRRMRATGIVSYADYLTHLKKLKTTDPEWDLFLQEITTHETYLFRDETHWNWLQKTFLPEFMNEARAGKRPRKLRIWSAACSTGDEAFSIATCIHSVFGTLAGWDVKIIGTDIGIGAVEQARSATFNARAVRLVPEPLKQKYFTKTSPETWVAKPALVSLTHFKQHNLVDPFVKNEFDVVFLKNVLIYFDENSKRVVLDHLRAAIKPGGLLVAGAAEGIMELVRDFERIQPWLYRRYL